MNIMSTYTPDKQGYYGKFGGAYIPEMLYPNVEELRTRYLEIMHEAAFQKEYQALLKDYVGRPSPLYLARRLSNKYNTVCALKGMECIVYMGSKDIERQAPNVARMKMLGAKVVPATSGSQTLKDATNEAIRDWINNPTDTHYIIGSVVGPHPYPDMVARFQSVISEEIRAQLKEKTGSELPTHVIACVGGGSNAAGAFYHFLDELSVELIAVEAAGHGVHSGHSAATTQLGKPGVLHGSKSLVMQTEDGQVVEPHSISAGLDYPGIGPLHAHLFDSGRATFLSATDEESLNAAFELTRLEGIIPALESAHALAGLDQLQLNEKDTVVLCLSGRGDKDMATYMRAMEGGL